MTDELMCLFSICDKYPELDIDIMLHGRRASSKHLRHFKDNHRYMLCCKNVRPIQHIFTMLSVQLFNVIPLIMRLMSGQFGNLSRSGQLPFVPSSFP